MRKRWRAIAALLAIGALGAGGSVPAISVAPEIEDVQSGDPAADLRVSGEPAKPRAALGPAARRPAAAGTRGATWQDGRP